MTGTKDRDSVRVALEAAFNGLPIKDQIALVAGWFWGAFDWELTPQRHEFWHKVVLNLEALSESGEAVEVQPLEAAQD